MHEIENSDEKVVILVLFVFQLQSCQLAQIMRRGKDKHTTTS